MKHLSSKYCFDDYVKLFIILLALFSPILVNSYNYIDDYGRSLYGYNGLDANGRPVAAIILWMTMWFGDVVDISPIPQIISVALIAASACFLKVSLERHTGYKLGILPAVFIFTAPTYLPMILFKYDSVSMAFSILTAISAFYVLGNNSFKSYALAFVLIILSMLSYQASISIFIILTCYRCIFLSFDKCRSAVRYIIGSAIISILAIASASLISKHFTSGGYNDTHSRLLSFNHASIDVWLSNSAKYLSMINMSYPMAWIIYAASILYVLYIVISPGDKITAIRKLLALALAILCPSFIFLHLSLLESPVFNIRTLIGTSFAIFMAVILFAKNTIFRKAIFLFLIAYNLTIYAATLNSIRYQMNHENNISTLVMNDLTSERFHDVKNIYTEGRVYYPQEVSNINRRFPVVMMLSQTYLGSNSFFGYVRLNYYLRDTKYGYSENNKSITLVSHATKPVIERKYYKIWVSGNDALISFK
ncbi:glucosyltransferase domain-containing protein [Escherichia coli]|uniref:glucosyltransferase domain-containing protein n=4 Tax=Escherichia coli TaxID=562 RepID=UPI000DE320C4|nr:glucosyltransferase domain-containing protein [Escherichia coli]NJQ09067.1 hypothetical protein [Escherichia coli]